MTRTTVLGIVGAVALAATATAQPTLQFRFSNGTSILPGTTPGSSHPVSIYLVGMPAIGSNINWLTLPGTGQQGQYAGFLSVLMDVHATTVSPVSWSSLMIPAGMGYQNPPFGTAGTASGSNVQGINIGVGFNPPVTNNEFLLWQGTITLGNTNVDLPTMIQPTGNPPYTGVEVALSGIIGGLNVSHFMTTIEGEAHIFVIPTPGAAVPLAIGAMLAARRRSRRAS